MELLAAMDGEALFRVPFVTSIVLALALPGSDPARPRAIVGGHMMSCLAGYLALAAFGAGETASAIAVGLATFGMMAVRLLHPPAGIDAFLVAMYGLPLGWAVKPVMIGAVLLAGFAVSWHWLETRLFRCPAESGGNGTGPLPPSGRA
jgi:CBS-domain-containing membrane protein